MCGIAGFVGTNGVVVDSGLVRSMCTMIEHRGPDDDGFYDDGQVSLGMRRLSIIDLAGGKQPVHNESGNVHLVFNGEIYNYRELREQLKAAGHIFSTESDSETIVHAYEEFGEDFPKHLEGMFAIALWDTTRQRFYLVRDRFGKKPLFYARVPAGLIFGSEIKCLLVYPQLDRTIDPQALDDYLAYGWFPSPKSLIHGVCKVRPGHTLVLEGSQLREFPYWQLAPRSTVQSLSAESFRDASYRLEELLEAAVRRRLVSDVPLGAFLSGGLDSSIVVALMARLSSAPVKTFTIGFDDAGLNEAPIARRTARALGTEHHELIVQPDFQHLLAEIIWGIDEPLGDPSMLPTFCVSSLAREHVTVCLTGDGGDETFAGYIRYQQAVDEQWMERLPTPLRKLAGRMGSALPSGLPGRNPLLRVPLRASQRYTAALTRFDRRQRLALYHPDWRATLGTYDAAGEQVALFESVPRTDILSAAQWVDVHGFMTEDVLTKVDRMSMVNSLETRAPLLDREVVEFAFGLPASALNDGHTGKILLRDVARRLIPAEILTQPKTGFGFPVDRWLRGPLKAQVRDALSSQGLGGRGWFDGERVKALVQEHERGVVNHGYRIWTLFVLELWAKMFLDSSANTLRSPLHRRP